MNKHHILELLANVTNTDLDRILSLPGDTSLSEIGLSSLSFIQFIVEVEESFGFEVLDSDLLFSNFQTIDMLFATLSKYFQINSGLKKALICDCDNCLWHGIAGEEDIFSDSSTNALHDKLINLQKSGILLCICSKNELQNIQHAFTFLRTAPQTQTHIISPDEIMAPSRDCLCPEHFVLIKANRNNKADNLLAISQELNLSPDSFVFLDDSDYELGLVNTLLPEVVTVKADYDKITSNGVPAFLDELSAYFSPPHLKLRLAWIAPVYTVSKKIAKNTN